MKNINKKSLSISGVCLILLTILFGVGAARAATYTVDTTADNELLTACTAVTVDCSLRGAINRANATIAADTIDFAIAAGDAGCPNGVCTFFLTGEQIGLTGGQLIINSAATAGTLTITNSTGASNLLISGNNASRVFYLNAGANLTLNAVTVTKGNTQGGGGGIINYGTLTLTNSTVSGNTAAGFGGGISNVSGSTLTLMNSTVSGNTGLIGGGISNEGGTTTLTNSTVSGNRATADGGGIYNNSGGTLTLTNSTVSGNTASGGGGIFNSGTLNLTSVTVAYNIARSSIAGGVYNVGTANLRNTIVAKHTAFDGPDFYGAVAATSSYNLIGNGQDTTGITNGTNGNQVGTSANPIDPKLDPTLALNGGTTLNHALLPDSPAIDKGNATGTDQRGATRPSDNPSIANAAGGNGADIGAFEVQTAPTAASVSVSGRVITQSGRGIRNVVITMTDSSGNTRTATSTSFGYYRFEEVAAGETYIFTARGKRFSFGQNSQVHSIMEDTNNINFIADDRFVFSVN